MQAINLKLKLNQIKLAAMFVRNIDGDMLSDFIREVYQYDTLGPILDPTAWMKTTDIVNDMKPVVEALEAFRTAVLRYDEKHPVEEPE